MSKTEVVLFFFEVKKMTEGVSTAQSIVHSIEELTNFIESRIGTHQNGKARNQRLNHKKKQKKIANKRERNQKKKKSAAKYEQIDSYIINLHLSVVDKDKFSHQNDDEKSSTKEMEYSQLINANKRTTLFLEWKNDFCLDPKTEDYLLNWMMQQFPYNKYGFSNSKDKALKLFIKQQKQKCTNKDVLNIKSNISGKCILEYDTELIIKTLNKFYDFRMRQWCLLLNKTLNMFFKDENERNWWNELLNDMSKINADQWFTKCVKWKIMPSRLLKDFIAQKKLFMTDYKICVNFDKYAQDFLDYFDDKEDLTEKDYFAPLGEYQERDPNHQRDPVKQELKSKRNTGYKSINTFLAEIGKIPHSKGGYEDFINGDDENAKIKQYKIYDKWIKYTEE